MNTDLDPHPKSAKHGTFLRYLYVITSFIGSTCFVNTLCFGSILYHWWHKITGQERFNEPVSQQTKSNERDPLPAYPNTESMRVTKDLRYYAQALGMDLEEFSITTEDGYILVLHHLIDPKDSASERDAKKPILLQHGLLSALGSFLALGQNSLAYYFVTEGYDVWLGNNRLGFEPKHAELKGNLMHNEKYWDWDMLDLAFHDLPCIIKSVLDHKPMHEQLVYVGHSQGCTQLMVNLQHNGHQRTHDSIEYAVLLAPAIFPGNLFHTRAFIKFLHNRGPFMWQLLFGCLSFLRVLGQFRHIFGTTPLFGALLYYMFKFLFGWNARKWGKDRKVWHFCFLFNISYVLARLMNWWLSFYVPEGFANQLQPRKAYMTDEHYKPETGATVELHLYFGYAHQWMDGPRAVPMLIFSCDQDTLVDGKRFQTHMRCYEPQYVEGQNFDIIDLDDYDHIDVIWLEDLIGRVGEKITDKLSSLDIREKELYSVANLESVAEAIIPERVEVAIPLWLDCDPGNDDAVALLVATKCPRFKLLGVSTVFGNATLENTTRNACAILNLLGDTNTPVYAGEAAPWVVEPQYATNVHGESGLGGVDLPCALNDPRLKRDVSYIDAIANAIEEYPHKICIVCIGALTNWAQVISERPELVAKVRWILIMGGALDYGNITPHAEFNFYADPHAADFVVQHCSRKILLAPLNLTHQVVAFPSVIAKFQARGHVGQAYALILTFYAEMYRQRGFEEGPVVHDPVALFSILGMVDNASDYGFEHDQQKLVVVTDGKNIGETKSHGKDTVHGVRIGTKINAEIFWTHVLQALDMCVHTPAIIQPA